MTIDTDLSLRAVTRGDVVLLSPVGRLDLSTYVGMRDGLLKHVAEQPHAVVVVLGPDLELGSDPLAAVFAAVWMRCCRWPGVPLMLVATTERHRRMLGRTGLSRFVPCHDRLDAALAVATTPARRHRNEMQLPPDTDAPHLARDFARRTCLKWNLRHAGPRAVLLAGELVEITRAHAGSTLVLRIERFPDQLTVAVRHTGPSPRAAGRRLDLTRIRRLSTACGNTPTLDEGRVLWAAIGICADDRG
ncbi:STAS domain-containing protein [Saccharothrix xinjiangensis]|uniref:STAS domain-containing protein n=1 Tax=Saccharothrix xinjiangensis TaxID=204798 RepID=A0ABV9Y1H5_9PSEU